MMQHVMPTMLVDDQNFDHYQIALPQARVTHLQKTSHTHVMCSMFHCSQWCFYKTRKHHAQYVRALVHWLL